ncbi:MAG: ATP-binding cassette domain-containing protein, partial [Gammaproteobacteria bacterium]
PSKPTRVVMEDGTETFVDNGHVVIAAITSCTNTSDFGLLVAAGLAARRARAADALRSVGMEDRMHHLPSELSGGMARRVGLARAIALDPALMMYDEPFAGLDPVALATVAQLIRRLNDALNSASIVVSHDLQEAFAIADYVYLLAGGRIAAHGTPDQIRASNDPNVRQFLEGNIDGPTAFHYQARPLAEDLGLTR